MQECRESSATARRAAPLEMGAFITPWTVDAFMLPNMHLVREATYLT